MLQFLYQLSLFFYRIGAGVISLINPKAKLFIKGRRNILKRITTSLNDNTSPIAWFHCASLGEFEQGRPIIERFKSDFPTYKVFLTFFSPSGYEVRKNYEHADYIFYLPWDSKKNARKLIQIVKPSVAIFVKYEFWNFYLSELKKQSIPLLSVSSIFRPNQIYFKPFGRFNLSILKKVTHFFVQNRSSKLLLEKHGVNNVSIAGDTRFDRVSEIVKFKKELPLVAKFKDQKKIMVIGSCWPEDLEVILPFINGYDMRFIVAPHEIGNSCIKRIQKESMKETILYSNLDAIKGTEDVLLVDNVGLLSSLYAYGEYAYIGGAFGAGLHNILEAATYGIPIFFGNKNFQKFNEATDLIDLGGAVAITSYTDLMSQFNVFKEDTALQIAGQVNKDYVKDNTGATDKIISYCKEILKS
jgi:3-deoxy-D-manno-octulosonic-acid transferase